MLLLVAPTLTLPARTAQNLPSKLGDLLGAPYIVDAAEDEAGRCVTFTHPDRPLATRGYNCSGFVVAACRRLMGYGGSLADAAQDRLGDSGSDAPRGRDWDFGWDLALNLSEGHDRQWLLPDGPHPVAGDARASQGFRVQDEAAWRALRPRLRADRVYLAVFNRTQGGQWRHHHVGLLLLGPGGRVWFYQTLPKGRAHRLDLGAQEGQTRLRTMFGPGERLQLLEVDPAPGSRR